MGEQLPRAENEHIPRPVTGLFRLATFARIELSPDGKAMPAGGEPRFAVKDVPVVRTHEGWNDFAKLLIERLEGVDRELYQNSRSVAESPMNELTDSMSPGEMRLITPEEYERAYINKYGDAIQGPLFW